MHTRTTLRHHFSAVLNKL